MRGWADAFTNTVTQRLVGEREWLEAAETEEVYHNIVMDVQDEVYEWTMFLLNEGYHIDFLLKKVKKK